MSRLGGYQLLDFKGYNFTSGTYAAKANHGLELYDLIKGTNKRTIVSGLVVGGIEYDDFEANFAVSGPNYVAKILIGESSLNIKITDIDTITITIAG